MTTPFLCVHIKRVTELANLGNTLKSLYSSLNSKKAIEDLQNLGIEVYQFSQDGTKQVRSFESIILDMMTKMHTSSMDMSHTLQDISGGKFQWSKVAALLNDYSDFVKAYTLSITSTNFAEGQVSDQVDTISRRLSTLKDVFVGIATGASQGGLSEFIKSILSSLTTLFSVS